MPSRRYLTTLIASLLFSVAVSAQSTDSGQTRLKLASLSVGARTYKDVVVLSVNARTVIITHAGGMTSLRLRDLAPELQKRFNYDPVAEAAAEKAAAAVPAPKQMAMSNTAITSEVDLVLRHFGQPAIIQEGVNLCPKYIELGLGIRNQGRSPSCSIYAVVSALEYQNARLCGRTEKFSEDYLIWATQKIVRRTPVQTDTGTEAEDADAGFSLTEVVNALRTYGIPLKTSVATIASTNTRTIRDPSPEIIREAREHQQVFVHQVPGRDAATRINNLVHALNAGMPIAVGMAWPNYGSLRNGYLSAQKPMQNSWHAVTIVGYQSKTGKIEDAYFLFRNSWGDNWGQGGYGTVTYSYLNNYLADAVLLEVQRS